jgi:hypothetical protein
VSDHEENVEVWGVAAHDIEDSFFLNECQEARWMKIDKGQFEISTFRQISCMEERRVRGWR